MTPEKLNIWDRFFNRYRREIVEEGEETWFRPSMDIFGETQKVRFLRCFVKYKVVDRLTGSETVEKKYFN